MKVFFNKENGDLLGTIDGDGEGMSMEIDGIVLESMIIPDDSLDSATDEYRVTDGKVHKKPEEERVKIKRTREEVLAIGDSIKADRAAKIAKVKDKKISDKEKVEILIDLLS